MKNNKLLYLLTIFITLFTFNINANAAQGLTCIYEKGGATSKIILIQDEIGTREIWANDKDGSIESSGWEKKYVDDISSVSLNKLDSNGNLTSCPNYANAPLIEDKVDFFDDYNFWKDLLNFNKWAPQGLDTSSSLDYVKKPTLAQVIVPGNGGLIDINNLDKSKYQASCIYRKTLENGEYHYVQLIYGKDSTGNAHINFTEYDPQKGDNGEYSGMLHGGYTDNVIDQMGYTHLYNYTFKTSTAFTAEYFINKYSGECAGDGIIVNRVPDLNTFPTSMSIEHRIDTTILTQEEITANEGEIYWFDSAIGNNPVTGQPLSNGGVPNIDIQFDKINVENCTDLVGAELAGCFKIIWNLVKIGIPILLIVLGVIDFIQATFASKEDEMKKAQTRFIKRIIIAAIIYLVPTLLGFLLKIANSVWSNIGTDICGIIF